MSALALSDMPWVPWPVKLLLKVASGVLPIPYDLLRRAGLGRHGRMDSFEYARAVVEQHLDRCGVGSAPFSAVEVGPGDSLMSAIFARALGCTEIVLVDVDRFAADDVTLYREVAARLEAEGFPLPDLAGATSLEGVCEALDARYLTDGVASLRSLPSAHFDAVWSQAVLEHVRLHDLEAVLAETLRVLKPGAVASHRVDLQDHLASSLNNLRFSSRVWESRLLRRSGAYTNRRSLAELVALVERVGFEIVRVDVERWPVVPIDRRRLAPEFRSRRDDELQVKAFDLVIRRPVA